MVQFDAKLRLPTALELPDSDETPADNELQDTVPGLLKDTLRLIWQNRNDWFLEWKWGSTLIQSSLIGQLSLMDF